MAAEGYVQVAVDGTGKKIRNLEVVIVDPVTGAERTVECQVVALMGPNGQLISADTTMTDTLLERVLAQLEELTELVRELGSSDTRQGNIRKVGRNTAASRSRT